MSTIKCKTQQFLPRSKRFTYKKLSLSDLPYFESLARNSHIRQYLMEGMDVSSEDCLGWVKASTELFKERAVGLYLVFQEGSLIGYAGFNKAHEGLDDIEVLFAFTKEHSGKGFATEVCSALLDASCSYLKNTKIIAVAHPENIASVKVLKKCGFVSTASGDGDLSHLLHFRFECL